MGPVVVPFEAMNPFRTLLSSLALAVAAAGARAGAPYFTDDPEPVDYQHTEIVLGFPARSHTGRLKRHAH